MSDARSLLAGGPGVGELFQIFRDGRARTRSEIAMETGLSRNTVTSKVDALIAEGLLAHDGAASSSGGRPPARLTLNASAWLVLAIDLGATHATVAITDLKASVLASRTTHIVIGDGPEAVLDEVLTLGERMLERITEASNSTPTPLIGVGIGLPGGVEHSTGRPIKPPIMPGWDDFDVTGFVRKRFDVTVLVDNDVNILALGEHELSWPDIDDLVFVKVATGLGAGIIAGRQLQRGAQGIAGDIGFAQVPYSRDSNREPDDNETLANLASASAILGQLRGRGYDVTSNADLTRLLRAGDATTLELTRYAGRAIGEVLATLVNTLNPSVIVLGGSVARASDVLLAGVREVVYRRSIPLATQQLQIVLSRAGEQAGVLGAAMLVVQEVLSPDAVSERVAAMRVEELRVD